MAVAEAARPMTAEEKKVIFASIPTIYHDKKLFVWVITVFAGFARLRGMPNLMTVRIGSAIPLIVARRNVQSGHSKLIV